MGLDDRGARGTRWTKNGGRLSCSDSKLGFSNGFSKDTRDHPSSPVATHGPCLFWIGGCEPLDADHDFSVTGPKSLEVYDLLCARCRRLMHGNKESVGPYFLRSMKKTIRKTINAVPTIGRLVTGEYSGGVSTYLSRQLPPLPYQPCSPSPLVHHSNSCRPARAFLVSRSM